jgi:hypothetical protein
MAKQGYHFHGHDRRDETGKYEPEREEQSEREIREQ